MSLALPLVVSPAPVRAPGPALVPSAPLRPFTRVVHGQARVDEYAWLREKDDPDVRAHLEAENAYAESVLAGTRALQQTLYAEMLGRILETDQGVPYREGRYLYYSRTEEARQYPILCRREDAGGGPEQVVLDLNELAEGRSYLSLGAFQASDDGCLLAYAVDDTGSRDHTLFVKSLDSGRVLERVAGNVGSIAWAADDRTLFYTIEDDGTRRQYRLFRHAVGAEADDALVYEETDPAFSVWVERTRSRAFVVLGSSSLTTSEARVLPAGDPKGALRLVAPRVHEQEYDVEHHGAYFYLRTNDAGENFRLVRAPVESPGRECWSEVVPHRDGVVLEGVDCFRDHLVLGLRESGLPRFEVRDLRDGSAHRIAFPEEAYTAFPLANPEFDTVVFRYGYESLVTPPSVFDYDMDAGRGVLVKQQPVLGGYDPSAYVVERVHAGAEDGTAVPVSLVYRRGLRRDGTAPIHLYGYGAYGYPVSLGFSSNRVSLLDRGVVVAIAHVRGGGELGKAWHEAGRMRSKRASFTDFVAAADMLVAGGYGSRDRLVLEGGSAGGLLVAAALNVRPGLCRAAVVHVPFVDVVNTMLDPSLPLTVGEFEEWGNPADPEAFEYMSSYCPYTNLRRREYPALLVRASLHDSQVMYWEPAKYVARLRAVKTDANPVLLLTNLGAGHDGASGRYDQLEEAAVDTAFVLWQMGVTE
jgi:oligopeptidase B